MKILKGRKFATALLGLLFACIFTLSVGLFSGTHGKSVVAATTSTTVAELASGTGAMFNGERLVDLYDALLDTESNTTGNQFTGTYNKVKEKIETDGHAVLGSGVSTKALTATDLGEIFVTLGGIEWRVTYLTKAGDDIIVDLMQKNSSTTSIFNGPYYTWYNTTYAQISHIYGTSYIRSVTLGIGNTYYNYNQTTTTQPQTVSRGTTAPRTTYSSFLTGDLSDYIEAPSAIDYQATESLPELHGETGPNNTYYNLPNEAYGTPTVENYFLGTSGQQAGVNTNYTSRTVNGVAANHKAQYEDWQNDKVWLPSTTEVAMWGVQNTGATWLRSGKESTPCYVYYLSSGGIGYGYGNLSKDVRPAIHFNLTKAEADADYTAVNAPQDMTLTYTGETYNNLATVVDWVSGGDNNLTSENLNDALVKDTLTGATSWFDKIHHALNATGVLDGDNYLHTKEDGATPCAAVMYKIEYTQGSTDSGGNSTSGQQTKTLEKFEIKDAGVYKITCKFEPGGIYKWRNPQSGTIEGDDEISFKIVVKQKKVKYEWQSKNNELNENSAVTSKQWKTTFAPSFVPADGALANTSKAPWPFITYDLLQDLTKGISDDTDAENTLTYQWDGTNSKHVVKVSGEDNITLPCIVLKFVSVESYDNAIEHIYANKNPDAAKGEKYPQQAGNYRVEAENVNEKTSNYELVAKDSSTTFKRTYEIEKLEIETPALPDPQEYTGGWVEFEVAAFNSQVEPDGNKKWYNEFVEYGNYDNDGNFVKDLMPVDDQGNDLGLKHSLTGVNKNKLIFKSHDAEKYTVYYHLKQDTVENTAVYPKPIVRNYKWKCTSASTVNDTEGQKVNGKSDDLKRVYEIAPKTLEFSFNSLKLDKDGNWTDAKTWDIKANDTTSKLTYDFAAGKEPVVIRNLNSDGETWDADADGKKEAPVLELWYYQTKTGDTGAKKPTLKEGDSADEFIFNYITDANNKHTAGEYTVMIKLAAVDADKSETLVNKNYRVKVTPEKNSGESDEDYQKRVDAVYKTYRQAIKLKPGEASLNDIAMKYQSDVMKENGDLPDDIPYELPDVENSKNLSYAWNTDKKMPLQYFFTADFTDIDFLEIDKSYGNDGYIYCYLNKDGTEIATLGDGEGFAKASFVRVKFKVTVKSDERTNNKMPKESEYEGTDKGGKFIYTAGTADADGNIFDGILLFDYEIKKAKISEDDLKGLALQYQYTGETKWSDYDSKNPPEYNAGKSITFQPNADKLPQGMKKAEVAQTLGDFKNPGTPTLTIKVTVDENYEEVKNYNLKPTISAQVIDTSAEMWKIENLKDSQDQTVKDAQGAPYQITLLNPSKLADATYSAYIDYEYWTMTDDGEGGFKPDTLIGKNQNAIDKLIDPEGDYKASSTNAYPVFVRPVLNGNAPKTATGVCKLVLKDKSNNSVMDADGNNGYVAFNFGESKDLIVVTQNKTSSVYGDSVNAGEILSLAYEDGTAFQTEHYILKIFDADKNDLGLLADFDFSKANAGEYTITIEFTDAEMAKDFVFTESGEKFTVEKKAIAVPVLEDCEFTGNIIDVLGKLGGTYLDETLKSLMQVTGETEGKNVKDGGYVIFIKLIDANYMWDGGDGNGKALTKYSRADAASEITDDSTVRFVWNINPFVIRDLKWNTSGTNAKLNVPENVQAVLAAAGLEIGYNYYDENGELVTELEKGKTYRAEAVLMGDGAELGNVVFEKTAEDGTTVPSLVSDRKIYETKKGVFDTALNWAKNNWWWLLVALAVLILLIVLIVVLVKRRKNKEERLAKKEAKEEEKRRREEEREEEKRRREEERDAEKRRREQELELEKAKQEAELAKMKAQMGLANAGAGMAAMAMAQQPQMQQQMPQPQYNQTPPAQAQPPMPQQPYPQPQYDQSVLAEIKAELAEIKARQNMATQQQMPMMQMPMQMPMAMQPQYSNNNGGSSNDPVMVAELTRLKAENEAHMKVELERARTETERARADAEIAKVRAESGQYRQAQYQQIPVQAGNMPPQYIQAQAQPQNNQAFSAEALGSIIGGVLRGMNMPAQKPAQPRAVIEEQTQPTSIDTPTVYPADAVITTTTTVDTTKPKATRSDDGRLFDVDGFYDTFEENK